MKKLKPVFNSSIAGISKDTADIMQAIKRTIIRGRRTYAERNTIKDILANANPYCYVAYEGNDSLFKHLVRTGVKCPHCSSTNRKMLQTIDKHVVLSCDCYSFERRHKAEMYLVGQCEKCGKLFVATLITPIEHSNHTYSLPTIRTSKPLNPYYLMKEFRGLDVEPVELRRLTEEEIMWGAFKEIICKISSKDTDEPISKKFLSSDDLNLSEIFLNSFQSSVMSLSICSYLLSKYEDIIKNHENFIKLSRNYNDLLDQVAILIAKFNTIKSSRDVNNSKGEDYRVYETLEKLSRILEGIELPDEKDNALLNYAIVSTSEKASMIYPVLSDLEYTKLNKEHETSLYAIL